MPAPVFRSRIHAASPLRKKLIVSQLAAVTLLACITTPSWCQNEDLADAGNQANKADAQLHAVYKQVTKQFSSNTKFLQKLQLAENAWNAYCDAYIATVFPNPDRLQAYGSNYQMCFYYRVVEATSTRTGQLKGFLSKKNPAATPADYQRIDNKLNSTYRQVVKIYDSQFIDVLRKAELKWIKFRDADADAYSEAGAPADKDTRHLSRMIELEKDRVEELKQWIDGTDEGDVCAGSIPVHSSSSQ
jgi:uncharacterized protein YecT (DUF1311 family)